jgi:predicted dehydrogenase
MNKTTIGIVGAGSVTRLFHLPVLLNMPNARVAWICDANADAARTLARSFSVPYTALPASPADLPSCDIALLAIPVGVRKTYYQALAAKGTAVFAEKPFAVTSSDHREFTHLFPEHALACGYMRRFYASTSLLKVIVAEQWFGPLQAIAVAEGARTSATGVDRSHYDQFEAAGGGVLITQGTHALDAVLYITAADSFSVEHSEIALDGRIDRKVKALIQLDGPNLSSCKLDFCVSWLDRQQNEMLFRFQNASLSMTVGPDATVSIRDHGSTRATLNMECRAARTYAQAFFLEWDDFIRNFREQKPSTISALTALPTTELVESLYQHRKKHK